MSGLQFEEIHVSLRSYKTIHTSISTGNLEQCRLRMDPRGRGTRSLCGLESSSQATLSLPWRCSNIRVPWGACKDTGSPGSDPVDLARGPIIFLFNQHTQ